MSIDFASASCRVAVVRNPVEPLWGVAESTSGNSAELGHQSGAPQERLALLVRMGRVEIGDSPMAEG